MIRRPVRALLLVLSLAAAGGAVAAPAIRFVSLAPGATPGTWQALLDVGGKPDRWKGRLQFRADGNPVIASVDVQGDRLRATLTAVPDGVQRLEAGTVDGQKFEPATAVQAGLAPQPVAPFDEWVIYHVYVATFRNADAANDGMIKGWKDARYSGGDLLGVIEKLDYVRELGANAIWLSPIFAAKTSHGYDVTNYWRVGDAVGVAGDPEASLALFRRLVKEAHARGLRVILDIPLNHASRAYELPAGDPGHFKPKASGPQQEAEKLWESWGSNYRYWSFDSRETRQFLVEAALHWIRDENVDGLRLDYARGVPHDFWAELDTAVKKVRPGAFLVGECWIDGKGVDVNAPEIATYYRPVNGARQFDSLLDFPLQIAMTDVFARGGSAASLEDALQLTTALYPPDAAPTYFLDNHDLSRFMDLAGDARKLVAAAAFMASLSGPEVIFYGTETGLAGGDAKPGFTDSGRLPMPWNKLDTALVGEFRAILAARAAHPALTRGARWPVMADKTALAMVKAAPDEIVFVGVNLAAAPRTLEIDVTGLVAAGGVPKSLFGAATARLDPETKKLLWTLPPMSTSLLAAPRAQAAK